MASEETVWQHIKRNSAESDKINAAFRKTKEGKKVFTYFLWNYYLFYAISFGTAIFILGEALVILVYNLPHFKEMAPAIAPSLNSLLSLLFYGLYFMSIGALIISAICYIVAKDKWRKTHGKRN
jgi:hypothetical protein